MTTINELFIYINKEWRCAHYLYGLRMGDGFLDALDEPLAFKKPIENECRTAHGKRIAQLPDVYYDAREITLTFTLEGDNREEFRTNKNAFLKLLKDNNGCLCIFVPALGETAFRLRYTGKSNEYSRTLDGCFCKLSLKFSEDDPSYRTMPAKSPLK